MAEPRVLLGGYPRVTSAEWVAVSLDADGVIQHAIVDGVVDDGTHPAVRQLIASFLR